LHIAALLCIAASQTALAANGANCSPVLNHTLNTLKGDRQNLCAYQGKVLLIVNTASYCGFTSQYKGLEALSRKYKEKGLVVLGFPSNDFGHQEPGSNQEVAEFCERTYQVKFPMFEKSSVVQANANPVYQTLAQMTGEQPKWNFHKYLLNRSGEKAISFKSAITPDDPAFVAQLEKLLAAP
jgi:glutathione peroxidase